MKKEIVERLEGFLTQKGSVILELNRQEAIDVLQSHQKLKDEYETDANKWLIEKADILEREQKLKDAFFGVMDEVWNINDDFLTDSTLEYFHDRRNTWLTMAGLTSEG